MNGSGRCGKKKEKWKDIDGYEGIYQISNFGRVKSLYGWNGKKYINREKILTGWIQTPNKKISL